MTYTEFEFRVVMAQKNTLMMEPEVDTPDSDDESPTLRALNQKTASGGGGGASPQLAAKKK